MVFSYCFAILTQFFVLCTNLKSQMQHFIFKAPNIINFLFSNKTCANRILLTISPLKFLESYIFLSSILINIPQKLLTLKIAFFLPKSRFYDFFLNNVNTSFYQLRFNLVTSFLRLLFVFCSSFLRLRFALPSVKIHLKGKIGIFSI